MTDASLSARFEEHRPRLRAVAYRMLGSTSETEDAVQSRSRHQTMLSFRMSTGASIRSQPDGNVLTLCQPSPACYAPLAVAQPVRLHHHSYLDYRLLEEASSTKHEFLEREIYAMAGGTPLHAALGAAVATSLSNQLAGSQCRVYSSDLRVRVLATGLAKYPDVTVVRGSVQTDSEDRNAAVNPKVVVEVLSDGTEEYDRGEKLTHYKNVVSLGAVVLVSQTRRYIEIWQRGEPWARSEARSGESLLVGSIGCSLAVDAIYDAAGAEKDRGG